MFFSVEIIYRFVFTYFIYIFILIIYEALSNFTRFIKKHAVFNIMFFY